jgi:hypothetical protein
MRSLSELGIWPVSGRNFEDRDPDSQVTAKLGADRRHLCCHVRLKSVKKLILRP